jgi:dCTP deaminase
MLNPNSYNYRLSHLLLAAPAAHLDFVRSSHWQPLHLDSQGAILEPGVLYLGSTMEIIGSDSYVTLLSGRSSVGRLGVFVQVDADLGHLGTRHKWTLEITVAQKVRVYPGVRFGQVSFWETTDRDYLYSGFYTQVDHPTPATPWRGGYP